MPLDETGTPNASGYFVNKQPIEQSEIKGAKAELDLLQYVTNMLYMAANEGPTMGNPAFDKWVDQQIELLREYAHQPQKEQEDDEDDDTDD